MLASGGNTYDRRMCDVLGPRLRAVTLPGKWPTPDAAASCALDGALANVPDGSVVLLDGLVACGVPHVVAPHARRLRLAILLHLPLGDETGLPADHAERLDAKERETVRAVAAVIATSAWAGRRIVEHHGLRMEKVHVVPPGTDPAPLATGSDGSRLLCLGSITPRKGQDVLAEALAGIVDLPWTCECVGSVRRDPGYVERLRGLITWHGLTGRMSLAGALPDADLRTAWAETDLLVLPSRGETFGMVVTEALARGIPVLTTDVDALPDTLGRTQDDGVPGILVPADDAPALSEALRRYLTRPMLRDRLRTAARERRRRLEDWDAAAGRLAGVLAQLRGEPSWAA
ncbi:MAG: glycosyltransferase [Actinophytocola sp.]|uniref:glycosyltransferase family 4 protein n=1 Tax=Actinophytocola sp. TaxID=1872138 RepID=UPI001323AC37|nr:glycosyltransferase family 4 protein [Actinophytocola sp.]MPZ83768.1 glycosyltransferase [Actinophytocola sp.]